MNNRERISLDNLVLPTPPAKGGLYHSCKIEGNIMFVSGCGCNLDGQSVQGKLGSDFTVEEGQKYAADCIRNVLAVVKRELGDLHRVKSFLKVTVYVASADDFYQQPQVANGATGFLAELFGEEIGLPARTAFGVNVLPNNMPVEIDAILSFETDSEETIDA